MLSLLPGGLLVTTAPGSFVGGLGCQEPPGDGASEDAPAIVMSWIILSTIIMVTLINHYFEHYCYCDHFNYSDMLDHVIIILLLAITQAALHGCGLLVLFGSSVIFWLVKHHDHP